MVSIPESVRVKIERANHHIADLDTAIARFWETKPYKVVGYVDAQGRPTYQVADAQPIDPMILAIAGDAIQNLRTALDYMACTLWRTTNGGNCKVYFPIADSAQEFVSEALRKVKGMRKDAVDAISALEPYEGGKGDTLWRLHKLSIIDKHRLPVTVAGGNLGIHIPSLYKEHFPELAESGAWIISVANFRAPLKKDDIVFVDEIGAKLQQDLQLPLFVFFDEAGVFERKPLVPSLKGFSDLVLDIVSNLSLLL